MVLHCSEAIFSLKSLCIIGGSKLINNIMDCHFILSGGKWMAQELSKS